ncbi:MAG: hypothetical protein A3H29_03220 [Acidobacteria bacterium RIFCSPLOWO2_02_FULL_67_21]|nr:MAG: hypothetical protein A3H29_03220 [Acidobacteria bacterium RIFCSPLOWO2_02_FULL_67_21]
MTIGESLAARMLGVVRSPRRTFEAVAAAPRWAGVLTLTCAVTAATAAAVFETEVGRLALLDQWERTAVAFGQRVDDATYAALAAASDQGAAYALASSLAMGPVLALGVAAAIRAAFGSPGNAGFRHVLAVVAHAGVVLMLRQIVAVVLAYGRETLASPLTLGMLVTTLDEASPLARLFGIVDLFVVWWILVLAIGVSVLYRRPARGIALTLLGLYLLLAAALAAAMALSGDALS